MVSAKRSREFVRRLSDRTLGGRVGECEERERELERERRPRR